ncbi:MAG: pyridoxal phosphate-dependent transferase, partial [Olpidium bornovanus]
EETRRYNSLNPADKATLSITRLLVGNRHFRVFLVVYSFMLHMLVLINTYQWAMTEECKHDHTEQICRQFATGFSAAGASVVGDPLKPRPNPKQQQDMAASPGGEKAVMDARRAAGKTARRVLNFAAGPACMPLEVLEKAQAELVDFRGKGMSLMEMSHRGAEYEEVHNRAIRDLRALLGVPEKGYRVLFLQGGGSLQFSAVVYNLLAARRRSLEEDDDASSPRPKVDYVITGSWSAKAAEEAARLGCRVNVVADGKEHFGGRYAGVPPREKWKLSGSRAVYVYYCDNETVDGVEFPFVPDVGSVPLVCDMSSNILSRPVDVCKFGVIYAGAQKNIGPAGMTVVIVREDLLAAPASADDATGRSAPVGPLTLNYKLQADNNSLYNTAPTFAIYLAGLVFEWLLARGGLPAITAANERKARKLYDTIDASRGFYRCPVDIASRSRMNVVFRLPIPELESKFVTEAEARDMVQLRGHRSVGGIRASIYNAMAEGGVEVLAKFMEEFAAANR